jgi:hypothetical protein
MIMKPGNTLKMPGIDRPFKVVSSGLRVFVMQSPVKLKSISPQFEINGIKFDCKLANNRREVICYLCIS